jgi:hypothetical protein
MNACNQATSRWAYVCQNPLHEARDKYSEQKQF